MKRNKGFTLIELMVVIVIIGILSALALPKMFGVSAKAKAAEAPSVIAHWETLQSAYVHETTQTGDSLAIGWKNPGSKWFDYQAGAGGATSTFTATPRTDFGDCTTSMKWQSDFAAATDTASHTPPTGGCGAYTANF